MLLQTLLLLLLGFLILIKGASWFIDGASSIAKRYHISELTIGLTIVAFGTSAPELVINIFATLQGAQEIVFGNVLGSNNFNLFIILGLSGLIYPLQVQVSTVWKEIPISLFAAVLLLFLSNAWLVSNAELSRIDGILLLAVFCLFMFYLYRQTKHSPAGTSTEPATEPLNPGKTWFLIFAGLIGLVFGGRLVTTQAVSLATSIGLSESIIGLTIIAAGTSLPELATSLTAAFKKNNDIAIGNIIGSNIFNIFLILGISSAIKPLSYNSHFNTDLYLLIGGTIFLFVAMFSGGKKKLDRWEAAVLFAVYVGYLAYLIAFSGS